MKPIFPRSRRMVQPNRKEVNIMGPIDKERWDILRESVLEALHLAEEAGRLEGLSIYQNIELWLIKARNLILIIEEVDCALKRRGSRSGESP
jgi:hypothetical protein